MKKPAAKTSTNANTQSDSAESVKIWRWIDEVIIGENFCPFAKVPREQGKVHLTVTEATNVDTLLSVVITQCQLLDTHPNIETALIACSYALKDFEDYLDTLDMAQQLLEEMDYVGIYQLASFHPDYRFEGEPADSPSHYTNRAPYPIFHLIREASITTALEFTDNPESIPERNIKHAEQLGVDFFKPYLTKDDAPQD
jgi:hypothetical protein